MIRVWDFIAHRCPAAAERGRSALGGVKMGNGERSGSGGRSDGPVRVATMAGAAAGAAVALFVVKPLIDLPFWLGLIAFVVLLGVGGVLGQLVGRRLFWPSSGGPPDGDKRAP
jgi:hypothetical protein